MVRLVMEKALYCMVEEHAKGTSKSSWTVEQRNHTSNIPSVHPPWPCCRDWTISNSRSTFTWSPICMPPGPARDPGPVSPKVQQALVTQDMRVLQFISDSHILVWNKTRNIWHVQLRSYHNFILNCTYNSYSCLTTEFGCVYVYMFIINNYYTLKYV